MIMLSGCQKPNIISHYDEFHKKEICRLDSFMIKNQLKFSASRATFITLKAISEEKIQVLIDARSESSLMRYDCFKDGANLEFILHNANEGTSTLAFKGTDVSMTNSTGYTYGAPISIPTDVCHSLINFEMDTKQFQKLINASRVEFRFESGNDPIIGELNDNDIAALKSFNAKCMLRKGK